MRSIRQTRQIYPHTSFAEEVDFLQTMFEGSAYVHGPLNSDHWYTYVADDCKRPTSAAADRTLNLMMYDLEPEVAENFYKSDKVNREKLIDVSLGCLDHLGAFLSAWCQETKRA